MDNDITQHSTSSFIGARYDEVKTYRVKYVEELQAESDRRLALLKRIDDSVERCPICHRQKVLLGSVYVSDCADGCELAGECHG